jgi:hypothetical protein
MIIGTDCLVCINGELLLGKVQSIYQYNVVVELYKDGESQVINKENVINSISSEAFEAIKEHYKVLVK